MSEVKHTPGPWVIDSRDKNNYKNGIINIRQGNYLDYESTCTIYPSLSAFEKALANAKLITAAPDLLNSLIEITKEYESVLKKYNQLIGPEFMDYQTIAEAQEIIKKATI